MTLKLDSEMRQLFENGSVLELGALAARVRSRRRVGYLADDQVTLYFDETPTELRPLVHFYPSSDPTEHLARLKAESPESWVHGLSIQALGGREPEDWKHQGLDSFSLDTGALDQENPEWESVAEADIPMVASFIYGPGTTYEALEERLRRLAGYPSVRTVVALPSSVGDRILLPGATTDGTDDMKILSLCRLLLPKHHVRISWGVLGWKVAQVGMAFGGDEIGGWGVEERVAYSHRLRPAATVGTEEVLAGLSEAGYEGLAIQRCDWEF